MIDRLSRQKSLYQLSQSLCGVLPRTEVFLPHRSDLSYPSCFSAPSLRAWVLISSCPFPLIIIHLLSQETGCCVGCISCTLTYGPTKVAPCRGGEWRLKSSRAFLTRLYGGGMPFSNSHKGTWWASHSHASNPCIVFLGISDSTLVFWKKLLLTYSLD